MQYTRVHADYANDYLPRQAILWNPIGHVIGLAAYCASPFISAGVLAGTIGFR